MMPYRIELEPLVRRVINEWKLPGFLLVDVWMRLNRDWLGTMPSQYLIEAHDGEEGMLFRFVVIDPENRLGEHEFTFRVLYRQDEESVLVFRAAYTRRDI